MAKQRVHIGLQKPLEELTEYVNELVKEGVTYELCDKLRDKIEALLPEVDRIENSIKPTSADEINSNWSRIKRRQESIMKKLF